MKYFLFAAVVAVFTACNGNGTKSGEDVKTPDNPDAAAPADIAYQIIKEYPHDTAAFTEGLQYVDGKLLESTGNYGESDLRITDLGTGKVEKKLPLDKKYFGEGTTRLNGKIYQMTYKENTCLVYDAATMKLEKTFTYNFGEGWGMTTDGTHLIISNGSSNIFFYNPENFSEVKRLGVSNQYGPLGSINELEYIKGFIYANIWLKDEIVKIDPASGKVVGHINLADLRGKGGIPPTVDESSPESLNGIAYDSATNRIFITGKNWPKLFEVKFDN